jgi:hypothetical protein
VVHHGSGNNVANILHVTARQALQERAVGTS